MPKPDSRIPVKEIYDAFQAWVVAKYGYKMWNGIGHRQVYAALKSSQDYQYVRFREGFCLKGIAYRPSKEKETKEKETTEVPSKAIETTEVPPKEVEIIPTELGTTELGPSTVYLNIVSDRPTGKYLPKPPSIILPTLGRRE